MNINEWITFLFWFLIAVIVCIHHVWTLNKAEERTKQLALAAKELDFEFWPQVEMDDLYTSGLDLFSHGYGKRSFNLMKPGSKNLEVMIFDYEYGQPRIRVQQSVLCFSLAENRQPVFLQGYSEKVLQKLFVRELQSLGKNPRGVRIEISLKYFVYYRPNVRVAPEKVLGFLDEGIDLFDLYLEFADQLIIV